MIASKPRQYAVKMSEDGDLQFRHPWAIDVKGYGVGIKVGFRKFSKAERVDIEASAEKLMALMPRVEADLGALELHPKLKVAYFAPLADSRLDSLKETLDKIAAPEDMIEISAAALSALQSDLFFAREKATQSAADLEQARNELAGFIKAMGAASANEKSLTLGVCFERWVKNLKMSSREDERNFSRRVAQFISEVGADTKICSISSDRIEPAVDASMTTSLLLRKAKAMNQMKRQCKPIVEPPLGVPNATERAARLQAVKRFFRDLCRQERDGGVGLTYDPAAHVKNKKQQQRRRVETLDPRPLMKRAGFPIYWKGITAVLGFGGLRLSEALSLPWENVDFKNLLIHVRPSVFKPKLKTAKSERPIKPFANIWPVLKALKKASKGSALLFPRAGSETGSWLEMRHGMLRSTGAFTEAYQKELTAIGVKDLSEPARRLRRFWSTNMRIEYGAEMESKFGGHSEEVAEKHYINALSLAEKQKVSRV